MAWSFRSIESFSGRVGAAGADMRYGASTAGSPISGKDKVVK